MEQRKRLKTDNDILRDRHRFIRTEKDDKKLEREGTDEIEKWEIEKAKNYYETLYKNFAIADLSRYKEKKIGLRWRNKKEVEIGKGEKICGNRVCEKSRELSTFEVPFEYIEKNHKDKKVNKKALVSLVLCQECAPKLKMIQAKEENEGESEEKVNEKREAKRKADWKENSNEKGKEEKEEK